MKRISTLILFCILFLKYKLIGQNLSEAELPSAVRENFKAKYPDVYVYKWEWKKKKQIYEAEYISKGSKYKTYYTANGEWVKTKRDIKKEEVPQEVWKGFSESEYVKWEIDDIEEHSIPKYDLVYEMEVKYKDKSLKEEYKRTGNKSLKRQYKLSKKKIYLYFSPQGELVDIVEKY